MARAGEAAAGVMVAESVPQRLKPHWDSDVYGTAEQAAEKVTLLDLLQNDEAIRGPASDRWKIFDS